MGLFLQMAGVIGASSDEVLAALSRYAQKHSLTCERAEGSVEEPDIGVIAQMGEGTTVLYPEDFDDWDDASRHLSQSLNRPVFSFHIHDGDLWMYLLFVGGKDVGAFNPIPHYWEEDIDEEEREVWKGDAELVASLVPVVRPEAIRKYLVRWEPEQAGDVKAYADDECGIGDCWQVCDFMKKLGLVYPLDDEALGVGETFYLGA